MAKIDFLPAICGVAVGTLPGKMVHRFNITVAAHTIRETGMIKCCLRPICGVVTGGALAWVMIDRRFAGVTRLAICETCVVKRNDAPGFSADVAAYAFAFVVIRRRIHFVAGLAFADIGMIIRNDLPVGCICMA